MKCILLPLLAIVAVGPSAGAAAQHSETTVINDDGWNTVIQGGRSIVNGSGRIVTQARPVSNFRAIELGGSADLHVRLGSRPSLSIQADDNLMPYLTSDVVAGTLRLGTRGSFRTHHRLAIYVTVPDVQSIRSRGSGNVDVTGVSNREIHLVTQGSGDLRARGRTGFLDAKVQGSGNADMRGIEADNARVAVLGSGNAWVATRGAVSAVSLGSGNVYVIGRPASLDIRQGGSGRVIVNGR